MALKQENTKRKASSHEVSADPPALSFCDVTVCPSSTPNFWRKLWPRQRRTEGPGEVATEGYASGELLKEVTFAVPPGAWFLLVGPSGSGKSTLLRAANNLVPLVSGCLLKFGVPVASWCRRLECDEATRTGTVLQTPSLFGHLTVLRNVEMGLDCCGPLWSGDRTNRAMAILDRMGIADLAHRFPHEISGGQQQRSAIARALVGEPRLLLMDEPLSALDAKSAETVCDVLAERRARGTTIVMASHRLTGCIDACSAKVLMASGRVEDVEWCNGHRAPAQHARATAAGGAGPLGVTGRASAEILRNEELQAWT